MQYLKIQKIQPIPVSYLYLKYIFRQFVLMVSVSKYLKDTEDTVQPFMYVYLYLRYIFSQLSLMASVSKYLKDTEDTTPHVSVSVS